MKSRRDSLEFERRRRINEGMGIQAARTTGFSITTVSLNLCRLSALQTLPKARRGISEWLGVVVSARSLCPQDLQILLHFKPSKFHPSKTSPLLSLNQMREGHIDGEDRVIDPDCSCCIRLLRTHNPSWCRCSQFYSPHPLGHRSTGYLLSIQYLPPGSWALF